MANGGLLRVYPEFSDGKVTVNRAYHHLLNI